MTCAGSTVDAADALGLGDRIGSRTPGLLREAGTSAVSGVGAGRQEFGGDLA